MNYYQPRQVDPTADRPDAGKWRYTCMNDGRVWPVGNCSPYRTCTACHGASVVRGPEYSCEGCGGKGYITVDDPCPGHDTPSGAYQHQTQYLLDNEMDLTRALSDQQRRCVAKVSHLVTDHDCLTCVAMAQANQGAFPCHRCHAFHMGPCATTDPEDCRPCDAWTQGLADVGGTTFVLCDQHRTREIVTELFGTVGDSFGTY